MDINGLPFTDFSHFACAEKCYVSKSSEKQEGTRKKDSGLTRAVARGWVAGVRTPQFLTALLARPHDLGVLLLRDPSAFYSSGDPPPPFRKIQATLMKLTMGHRRVCVAASHGCSVAGRQRTPSSPVAPQRHSRMRRGHSLKKKTVT